MQSWSLTRYEWKVLGVTLASVGKYCWQVLESFGKCWKVLASFGKFWQVKASQSKSKQVKASQSKSN